FPELLNLAEDGNTAAQQALARQAQWIGRGLRMIIAALSPSTILIAGEVSSAWHRFGPIIEREAADLTLAGTPPLIRPTHESEIARLRGAAALVFQRKLPRDSESARDGYPADRLSQAHPVSF
ncbi:MAG: ROK family protein, partial [Acidobacteriaceae bacterium]